MNQFDQWMWMAPVAAQAAAAFRLALAPAKRKHAFLLALILSMLAFELLLNLSHGSTTRSSYLHLWLAAYLANFSLVALALTEACTHSIESYERFGEAGRRFIRAILVSSGIAMIVLLFILPDNLANQYTAYFQAQAYLGQGSLALLGFGLLLFASWARLRLHRNAKLTIVTLTGLCALEGILGSTMSAAWPSGRVYLGISGTLLLWGMLIFLWKSELEVKPRGGSGVGLGQIAPALARMEAMNRQLDELVRRG